MTPLVPITMFGWIPVVLLVFTLLRPRRAVIACYLIAWLFLPVAKYQFSGFPEYTKMSATATGLLLGAVLFDPHRLTSFRFKLQDVPAIIWCLSPIVTSLLNGLGPYDGASSALRQIFLWGIHYVIGRLYFSDMEGLREAAMGIFIGGLIYLPLCLFEVIMSPQLHIWLYGYNQLQWSQTKRWGGWRPNVFMQHGLMVAMWMAAASLVALWLWQTGAVRRFFGIPLSLLVIGLFATTIVCKSAGAILLLLLGVAVLYGSTWLRTRWLVRGIALVPALYLAARITGVLSASTVTDAATYLGEDRAGSMLTRVRSEDLLIAKAMEQPLFGWGAWGRGHVQTETATAVYDALTMITLSHNGLVRLGALLLLFLVPTWWFLRRIPPECWRHPQVGALVVLVVCMSLYMLDNLFNAMVNPIFVLVLGGLTGLAAQPAARTRAWLSQLGSSANRSFAGGGMIRRPAQVQAPGQRGLHGIGST